MAGRAKRPAKWGRYRRVGIGRSAKNGFVLVLLLYSGAHPGAGKQERARRQRFVTGTGRLRPRSPKAIDFRHGDFPNAATVTAGWSARASCPKARAPLGRDAPDSLACVREGAVAEACVAEGRSAPYVVPRPRFEPTARPNGRLYPSANDWANM